MDFLSDVLTLNPNSNDTNKDYIQSVQTIIKNLRTLTSREMGETSFFHSIDNFSLFNRIAELTEKQQRVVLEEMYASPDDWDPTEIYVAVLILLGCSKLFHDELFAIWINE